jgi:hypothetical protein
MCRNCERTNKIKYNKIQLVEHCKRKPSNRCMDVLSSCVLIRCLVSIVRNIKKISMLDCKYQAVTDPAFSKTRTVSLRITE